MTDAAPLTQEELRFLRSLLRGFTTPEWRALKAIAKGVVDAMNGADGSDSATGPAVAPDSELDSRFGDPTIRRDPKYWAGASYVGARYSECPSEYLIIVAESLEYFVEQDKAKANPRKNDKGVPYWQYNMKDAARARGWARRNHGKSKPPPKAPEEHGVAEESYDQSSAEEYSEESEGYAT